LHSLRFCRKNVARARRAIEVPSTPVSVRPFRASFLAAKSNLRMHFQTTRGPLLKKVLDVVGPILIDGNMIFSPRGITIEGFSRNTKVTLSIPFSGADSFETKNPEETVGIDFNKLLVWLKSVVAGDLISLSTGDQYPENVICYKHWNSTRSSEINFPALKLPSPQFKDDTPSFLCMGRVDSKVLESTLKRHSVMNKHCAFRTKQHALVVISDSEPGATYGCTTMQMGALPAQFLGYRNHARDVPLDTRFSIKALLKATKAHLLSSTVVICVNRHDFVQLVYSIDELGLLSFRISPEKELAEVQRANAPGPPPEPAPGPVSSSFKRKTKRRRKQSALDSDQAHPHRMSDVL
jgi:hypothetical protein